MKKILLAILIIIILGLIGLVIYFYPSLNPVLGPAPLNIVGNLPNANQSLNQPIPVNPANPSLSDWKSNQQGPLTILGNLKISIFADKLNTPRVLLFDPAGNLLVSAMGENSVYAIKPDQTKIKLISGLNHPHGLAIKDGYLYIAETDKVQRYTYDQANLKLGTAEKLFDLPASGGHSTRTIKFGIDGYLYVSVGSSCNVCDETDPRRSAILKYNPKDWTYEIFSSGLRNTAFFINNPLTNQWWGNDMGRDLLGDNIPPDELNILQAGKNYGWPVCYGQGINDRNFDTKIYIQNPCNNSVNPIWGYPAHNAPLGLVFINSPLFPKEWQGDLLVSLHGSWNRSVPDGYKVVHLKVKGNSVTSSEDFITGFLKGNSAIGRPVDLVFGPDGSLYLSDDKAGVIYVIK
jgi:glucose/arabinose dehydrogenase